MSNDNSTRRITASVRKEKFKVVRRPKPYIQFINLVAYFYVQTFNSHNTFYKGLSVIFHIVSVEMLFCL